jgi:hypothetical protein
VVDSRSVNDTFRILRSKRPNFARGVRLMGQLLPQGHHRETPTRPDGSLFLSRLERRAQALQKSMLKMLDSGDDSYTHPGIWAPFVVVGD